MRGDSMAAPDPETTTQILQNPIVQWGARWIGEIIFGLCLALLAILKFIGKRALADIDNLKSIDVVDKDELDARCEKVSEAFTKRLDSLEEIIKKEIRTVHARIDGRIDNNKKED